MDFLKGAYRVSVRRACGVLKASRSSYRYKARRPEQTLLRLRIRDIAHSRIRYGYRRIHTLLCREGWQVNVKRVYRLYKIEGLQMRRKVPRRRVSAKLRDGHACAIVANECWSMDFVSDALFDGRKLRALTVVDTFTRLCPVIGVDFQYKATDVVQTLNLAAERYGLPKRIRCDNGPEFVSKELDLWAYAKGVELDFSRPGKPTDNAHCESFNSRFRQECLNGHWFMSREDAREKIETWRKDYNLHRPHSSLGGMTPIEFASRLSPEPLLC